MSQIQIDTDAISAVLEENARKYSVEIGPDEIGHVLEAGDGVARVDGLPGVMVERRVAQIRMNPALHPTITLAADCEHDTIRV